MRCGIYIRVSTDDQRDNGYSIDSQLRMIKEYCEKNEYDIVDVYNDAGHSGKDLMRPEMQRLLKDIKSKKIDKLVAIKVDRLTRNNYDGFWLLNYCEEHDVISYAQLFRYARSEHFDWFRVLCDSGTLVIKEYLKSRKWAIDNGFDDE